MSETRSNPNEQKPQAPASSIFDTAYYLKRYESISIPPDSRYLLSARVQVGLANEVNALENTSVAAELGCGTGNPTYLFLQSFPKMQLMAIDPSRDALKIASYKFGQMTDTEWSSFTSGIDIPDDVREAIEKRRVVASQYKDRVKFLEGRAEDIPVDADLILGVQFFHWPEDTTQALRGMRNALKPDNYAIFDTSGLQLDWGNIEYEGKKINDLHPMGHPFHLKFLEALNAMLSAKGLPQLNPKKLDTMHHKFSVKTIIEQAKNVGFIPRSIDANRHKELIDQIAQEMPNRSEIQPIYSADCTGILIPLPQDEFKDWITKGGKMRYFNNPLLQGLNDDQKQELIDMAFSQAEKEHKELLDEPAMESLAYFSLLAV